MKRSSLTCIAILIAGSLTGCSRYVVTTSLDYVIEDALVKAVKGARDASSDSDDPIKFEKLTIELNVATGGSAGVTIPIELPVALSSEFTESTKIIAVFTPETVSKVNPSKKVEGPTYRVFTRGGLVGIFLHRQGDVQKLDTATNKWVDM